MVMSFEGHHFNPPYREYRFEKERVVFLKELS